MFKICLITLAMTCAAWSQASEKPTLREGIAVRIPTASHAVETRAADEPDATVITVMEGGKLFVGVKPAELNALGTVKPGIVFLKADSRVPYQTVLSALDALHGRTVVLLTAPPPTAAGGKTMPPYGIELTVAH